MAEEAFVQAGEREVRISSGSKVMFPDHGWTKMDLVSII